MITTNQAVGGGGHPLRIVPGAPIKSRSVPETSFTDHTGHMVYSSGQLTLAVIAEPGGQFLFTEFTSSQSDESHRSIRFPGFEIYAVYPQETD